MCQRETSCGANNGIDVRVDACVDADDDEETKQGAETDRAQDTDGDPVGGVFCFFRHVHAGVECTDGPDCCKQGENELETDWPIGEVVDLTENELTVVEATVVDTVTDWDCDKE